MHNNTYAYYYTVQEYLTQMFACTIPNPNAFDVIPISDGYYDDDGIAPTYNNNNNNNSSSSSSFYDYHHHHAASGHTTTTPPPPPLFDFVLDLGPVM